MKIFLLLLLWLMLIFMLSYFCFLTKKGDIKNIELNSTIIKKEYSKELNSSKEELKEEEDVNSSAIEPLNGLKEYKNENRTPENITAIVDKRSREDETVTILKEEKVDNNKTKDSEDINSSKEEKLIKQYEYESNISTPPTPTPIIRERDDEDSLATCRDSLEKVLSKNKIYFYNNSAKIQKKSYPILDKIIDISKECKSAKIVIAGYTDSLGTKRNNLKVSRKRANSVKDYFIEKGIEKDRLEAVGYGEANPIASNKTAKGREKNRRIEISIKGER